jgi:hypothetical protein
LKDANEREAGNKEPPIDTDTGHEAQNNVEESVASEEPVEEPGQELAPEMEPEFVILLSLGIRMSGHRHGQSLD